MVSGRRQLGEGEGEGGVLLTLDDAECGMRNAECGMQNAGQIDQPPEVVIVVKKLTM